jgi:hypothetical protein
MPVYKHTHKYEKKDVGKVDKEVIVYACALPGCTHYLRPELLNNKFSICWKCGETFIIRRDKNGFMKKPWCDECRESLKKNKLEPKIETNLDMLIRDLTK